MEPKVFGDQGSGDGPGGLSRSRVRKKPRMWVGKELSRALISELHYLNHQEPLFHLGMCWHLNLCASSSRRSSMNS